MSRTSAKVKLSPYEAGNDLNLPEGWVYCKISDILKVNYGKGLIEVKRNPGNIPVYGSNGIVGQHNIALTKGPTIIIGRKGSVGTIHFSKEPCWPIDTSYFIDELDELSPIYLLHVLRSLTLSDLDTSTAIPGLNRNDLYDQPIPLPPLPEQKRIVAKVEELLVRANATKERLAKVSAILKRFRQSVLAAAVSGRLTADWRSKHPGVRATQNEYGDETPLEKPSQKSSPSLIDTGLPNLPETWFWAPLGQCASICRGRFSIRPRNNPRYYGGQYPFVQIGDLPPDGGKIKTFKQTLNKEGLAVSSLFPAGTVLIAIVGATIGNTGLLNFDSCCPDSLVAIKGKSKEQSRFIEYYLRWKKLEIREESYASGGQPNINLQTLIPYPIPVAPQMEIEEIVRRVEALFQLADSIEKHVTIATARAESLAQAILAKAFRDELVPTEAELARREGRSYEPASTLLARIKAKDQGLRRA